MWGRWSFGPGGLELGFGGGLTVRAVKGLV